MEFLSLRPFPACVSQASLPSFPHDYPDCSAYNQYMAKQAEEKQDLYKKKPPSKRGLYPKLDSLWQFAVGATSPKVEGSSQVESSSSPKFIPMTPTDAVVSIIPEGSSQSVSDALEDQALGGLTMEGVAAADFVRFIPQYSACFKIAELDQITSRCSYLCLSTSVEATVCPKSNLNLQPTGCRLSIQWENIYNS